MSQPYVNFVRKTRRIRSFEPLESRQLLAADIVINEIMYHPADNRSSLEFIELYNRSDQTVSLQNWQFDNGVDFTFPTESAIPAHGFLVVAADVDQFASQYPDISNLVGGWSGRLANRGEVLRLVDGQGTVVDRIRYADEGEWASRFLAEPDLGFQGWKWRAPHDGEGPSLELQNAALPNEFGGNWHSSSVNGGTPGKVNSVAADQIPAITSQVSHAPPIPSSQDVVTVTVNVIDEDAANAQVTVHFRNEQSLAFTSTTARPVSNSTSPHQTTFAASLPAFPNGTIVEFYFTVTDQDGNTSIDPALETNAADRTANYLYQVIDGAPNTETWQANDQPIHYLIMRDSERLLLADIGDGPLAQAESNAQMNGTLIRIDGNGTDVRYLTGIRNRGGSSRIGPPNNYRINVPHDRPLDDAVSLNFNSRFTHAQVIGSAIFRRAGLTAAEAAPIQVRLNNLNLAEPDGPLMFGSYVSMEVVNGSFPDNHYPDDRRGNFYRAFAFGTKNASLDYLGPDAAPYAESYEKITNEEDNDWSDIIRLTQVLTDLPDQDFVAELEQTIHVDQWLRYLALDSLLGNLETGLNLGTGDNFWLYRGTVDRRFEIIPHDLDTILGRARVGEPNRSIFTYTNVPGLRRLLTHPDLVPRYYQAFLDLMDEVYNPETLHPLLDQLLGDWVPADELSEMKQFIVDRTAGVLAQIPQEFTITSQLDEVTSIARSTQPAVDLIGTANAVTTRSVTVNGQLADWSPFSREWSVRTTSQGETTTLIPFGSHWRFLDDGSNQGTRWRRSDFDDVPWRTGIAPLGYGEGNEATVVSFGSNSADKYVTTYFRQTFDVADVDQVRDLTLRLRRDDGAVVYLNGQEVVRSNMPGGDIDFQTVASSWIGGGLEGQTLSFAIDPSLLVANDNILAVEIHQRSPIDDDLRFDLELEASVGQIQGGVALLPGSNRITVEAFDGLNGTGNVVDVDAIDVWYDGAIGKDSATCNSYQQFGSLQTNSQLNNVTLTEDTVLAACGAAYRISGQLTVPAGVTLTIMPGTTLFFEEDAGLTVDGGRLVADGTPYETIRFTRSPSSVGSWQGIQFVESMQGNRLRHAIVEHGVTEEGMVGLRSSQLLIESTTFDHTDRFRIRTVDSSLVIRNSRFEDIFAADQPPTTDNRSEHIWGSGIADDGQLLIEGNYFGTTKGHNDAMDFDGAERPGPIPVIINNFFAGTGDDALDLETDAHIEGNVFRNVRKDEFNSSTGDANAISAGNGRHYVVVRNTFENVDHAVQVKDEAFLTFDHNTVVGVPVSAIYFDLPDRSPGKGAIITDSIFADTVATFSAADQAEIVEVHRSLVMPDAVAFGSDNFVANARFVAPQNHDFRLRPSSPAVNFGDSGLDLGAAVQTGAVIGSLRPERETTSHSAAFQIFGAGVEAYRYQVNDQPLSEIRSLDEPIELSNLANGMQRLRVIGRDSAGRWQALHDADEYEWTINDQLPPIRINEVLASNDSAFSASETYPDAIEIQNLSDVDFDLVGMSISDDAANPRRYVFPPNTIIPAAGYLVLIADDRTDFPGVHLGFGLNADGEGVYLFAENGDTLDSVEFGLQVTDFSIGRVGDAADWQLTSPTLGSANQAVRTGDGEQLHINEWLASNSVRFNDDYVELYNADDLPVELSGLYLSDDLTIDRYQHAVPPLSFIPAHGFAVFQADENSGANHLSFRLNAEGEQLALIHRDGTLLDHVLYFAQQTDRSQGRSPDGSSHWQNEELPTPGQPNPVRIEQTIEHIRWDATWAYNSSGQSLPANWMTAEFDDHAWPQSTGVFAQQDAVLPLPVGTTIPTGVLSQRFRTSFQIGANTNLDAFTWTVSTLLDDGAVIYINGAEWLRIGMPHGEITETTRANRGVSSATVEGPLVIPTELLVHGENIIAVDVRQVSPTSNDVAFGFQLVATTTLSDLEVDRAIDLLHGLRISEVMYHPQDSESLEFIEVTNVLDYAINLRGVRLGGGVDATLGDALLSPGERAVVVANAAAFRTAYGESIRILAEYDGQLRNSSEQIQLQLPAPYDAMILDFEYDDAWYISTDGQGASLELRSTNVPVEAWRTADAWQASVRDGGTPGSPPITLDGDVNQDTKLDIIDVDLLCLHIRTNQQVPTSDVNSDGQVNDVDLSDLIGGVFQTSVGDVNLDGKFDSADLVLIFQAGEYQDSRIGNSMWSTGDWNCDGEFDSSDLVVAFQTGRYQA